MIDIIIDVSIVIGIALIGVGIATLFNRKSEYKCSGSVVKMFFNGIESVWGKYESSKLEQIFNYFISLPLEKQMDLCLRSEIERMEFELHDANSPKVLARFREDVYITPYEFALEQCYDAFNGTFAQQIWKARKEIQRLQKQCGLEITTDDEFRKNHDSIYTFETFSTLVNK